MEEVENRIRLLGELDSKNVSEIEKQLHDLLKSREHLVVDLNELENIDISGMFMLFMLKQDAQKNYKSVTYLLDSSAIITGNILGIKFPKLI